MRGTSRLVTASLLGVLMLLGSAAGAQPKTTVQPTDEAAVIHGLVTDDAGAPVAGAMVSATGASTTFAIADRSGKFELGALTPGSYLVRAHRAGFAASRTVAVEVRAGGRVSSTITLRKADPQILAAGVGLIGTVETAAGRDDATGPGTSGEPVANADEQKTE